MIYECLQVGSGSAEHADEDREVADVHARTLRAEEVQMRVESGGIFSLNEFVPGVGALIRAVV